MGGTELEAHQPHLMFAQSSEEMAISLRVKFEKMPTLTLEMDASTDKLNLAGLAPQQTV